MSLLKMQKLLISMLLLCGLSACGLSSPFPDARYFTKHGSTITAHDHYTFALASTEDEDILTVSFRYNLPTVTDQDGMVVVDERFDGEDGDAFIQSKLNDFKFQSVYIKKSLQYPNDLGYTETDFARMDLAQDAFGSSIETECKMKTSENGTNNKKDNKAECTLYFPAGTFPVAGKKFIRILGLQSTDDAVEDFLVASPKLNISKANPVSEEDDSGTDDPNSDDDPTGDGNDDDNAGGDEDRDDDINPGACVSKATYGGSARSRNTSACADVSKTEKGRASLSDGGSCSLNPKTQQQNLSLLLLLGGALYLSFKRRHS